MTIKTMMWGRFLATTCLIIGIHVHPVTSLTLVSRGGSRIRRRTALFSSQRRRHDDDDDGDITHAQDTPPSLQRRDVLLSTLASSSTLLLFPSPSYAGEVGAKINAAVTKSELGIAVRESVVRGAQTMDSLDGKWEQFSDKFGLGAARSQQPSKPQPKVIPEPLPLDTTLARRILELSDQSFLSLSGIKPNALSKQVDSVADKVRPSFERSGAKLENPGQQFSFDSYTHFKAYSDLLVQSKGVSFQSFRKDFEHQVGQELLTLLLPEATKLDDAAKDKQVALRDRLRLVDRLCTILRERGFVAATEQSPLDKDQVADWADDLSDLTLSVALDGDVTMNAQILLQEQGFRLYPNYARFILKELMNVPGQSVAVDDYYLDTDYNSDPNLFEAKEVMLNIILDSS